MSPELLDGFLFIGRDWSLDQVSYFPFFVFLYWTITIGYGAICFPKFLFVFTYYKKPDVCLVPADRHWQQYPASLLVNTTVLQVTLCCCVSSHYKEKLMNNLQGTATATTPQRPQFECNDLCNIRPTACSIEQSTTQYPKVNLLRRTSRSLYYAVPCCISLLHHPNC
jgi:hypothetical protein